MKYCAFLVALLLVVPAWSSPEASSKFLRGFVEGFIAGDGKVEDCLQAPARSIHDAEAVIANISKGHFVYAIHSLAALHNDLEDAARSCAASEGDLKEIESVLRQIHSMKGLLGRVGHEIYESGPDIGVHALEAQHACKSHAFEVCGVQAGEAMRLLVIGATPAIPPPPYNLGMQERTFAELSKADPSDVIEVYWNLSPLCMEQFRKWMGLAGLFHNSVGFKNLRTGLNTTIEFTANNLDASLVLPSLNYADKSISWNNTAALHAKEGSLDLNYWPNRTHIASVDGTTFNQLMTWGETATQSKRFQQYFLFNLASSKTSPQLQAFTCAEAAAAVVNQILVLAGPCVFKRSVPGLFQTAVVLTLSHDATRAADSKVQDVFAFYEAFEKIPRIWSKNLGETVREMMRLAELEANGHAVYQDRLGQYWMFEPARPFLEFRGAFEPLPGDCKDTAGSASDIII